jgi:hypothetical protein
MHERRMAANAGVRPIPWETFDRTRYSDKALAIAAEATLTLASGEYGAVALFGAVASALSLHGCPFDMVSAAANIPSDEARHAEYATRMTSLLNGKELAQTTLDVNQEVLLRRCVKPTNFLDLDILMLELPAISESIAAAMLHQCQRRARDPVVRRFYANIVRDEVHHARLGWYYLAWRAPQWTQPERQRISDRAGEIVVTIEQRFSRGRDAPKAHREDARALGVLDTPTQSATIRRLMEDEMVPALDRLGLGASHAWRARRRAKPSVNDAAADGTIE